ncbi:flagellar basal body-associated FliL family protein [Marinobacter oulmenensis]|uniref:Flagellar protein FliL n=1 Tax=Marinobacter oulmenensis TaxID=643747 RepID=A0A840U812_9GAMM|nr:flagellar basal body-associated FliL family protein [Marinobacter oulmenensis]MBB5321269.1 flagellar FliL protein [Marinobacter oulmenensis]
MAENNTPEEAPAKKGKLKLIIMLIVIILLAIGLSVAGTLWFLGGSITGDESTEADAEPEFIASTYTDLEDALVTTIQAQGRQRFAQVYLSFEAKDPEALAAVDLHMPLIRSQLVMVLGNSDFTELQTPEGRQALAQRMLEKVNQVLEQEGEPAIIRVLLRNFVVQ